MERSLVGFDLHETLLLVKPYVDPKTLPFTYQEITEGTTGKIERLIEEGKFSDLFVVMLNDGGHSYADQWKKAQDYVGVENLMLPQPQVLEYRYAEAAKAPTEVDTPGVKTLPRGVARLVNPFYISIPDVEGLAKLKQDQHLPTICSATSFTDESIMRDFLVQHESWDPFLHEYVPGMMRFVVEGVSPLEAKIVMNIFNFDRVASVKGMEYVINENDRRVVDAVHALRPQIRVCVPISRAEFLQQDGYPVDALTGKTELDINYKDVEFETGAYEIAGLGTRGHADRRYFISSTTPLSYTQSPALNVLTS